VITIAEVIEEVAEECEVMGRAWAIRTLKAKYEGCIVADGSPAARTMGVPLYRAKEPTK
jgi:hypothetical protein